jgi:hypothetical protein
MTQQVPVRPTAPAPQGTPPVVDPVDQAICNEDIRQFVRNKAAIIAAMKAICSVIWGQCSEGLRSKLKSNSSYNGTSADANSLALLKEIRSEMTGFKKRNYLPHSVHSTMREFYNLSQGKHRTNQEYYDEFNKLVAAVDECGTMVARHPAIYDEVLGEIAFDGDSATADEISEAKSTSRERYLAVAFLLGADRIRYGIMIEEIENEYLRNRDKSSKVGSYPLTVADAYEYLENYKRNSKYVQRLVGQADPGPSGMAFVQQDDNKMHQKKTKRAARKLASPSEETSSATVVAKRTTNHPTADHLMKNAKLTRLRKLVTVAWHHSSPPQ